MRCPRCGYLNYVDLRSCLRCGLPLLPGGSRPDQAAEQAPLEAQGWTPKEGNNGQAAGFLRRGLAYLLDEVILLLINLGLLLEAVWVLRMGPDLTSLENMIERFALVFLALNLLAVLIHVGYFTYFVGGVGQTPGKMLLRLRVVPAAPRGSGGRGRGGTGGVGYGRALVRALAYLLSLFPLGAGFWWALFDRRRRTWHDHLAGTRVIPL